MPRKTKFKHSAVKSFISAMIKSHLTVRTHGNITSLHQSTIRLSLSLVQKSKKKKKCPSHKALGPTYSRTRVTLVGRYFETHKKSTSSASKPPLPVRMRPRTAEADDWRLLSAVAAADEMMLLPPRAFSGSAAIVSTDVRRRFFAFVDDATTIPSGVFVIRIFFFTVNSAL